MDPVFRYPIKFCDVLSLADKKAWPKGELDKRFILKILKQCEDIVANDKCAETSEKISALRNVLSCAQTNKAALGITSNKQEECKFWKSPKYPGCSSRACRFAHAEEMMIAAKDLEHPPLPTSSTSSSSSSSSALNNWIGGVGQVQGFPRSDSNSSSASHTTALVSACVDHVLGTSATVQDD